ncbi:Rieske (2Fe-2S) protein [Uliginosibacterium sp. 31-16]|uniref:Rieske (2Fe-2S) protein n=1 Tax=Uliginosibacterium sp. 31-16 TaxID=3068315 RepID=UPI00273F371D|nr:Rieske (2Fe-2S) protein [Uliginosibacterium sp. 31-16]MDP5240872.1 Rieske (2Fe-2S) protein [Uliginosibacterium sp. 31-16]
MSRLICAATDLLDGGDGLRFQVDTAGGAQAAFVLRWHGGVYAYLNQCAHVAIELDWNPGKFLDVDGEYVMCAAHGALYEPDSGRCVGGPCVGQALRRLMVSERNGNIYLEAEA